MINAPIQPIIHEQLSQLLVRHFEATPEQAVALATKLIKTLNIYDLDIIRGKWMEMEPKEVLPIKEDRWTTLALAAEELVQERGGIKPWMPPELQ